MAPRRRKARAVRCALRVAALLASAAAAAAAAAAARVSAARPPAAAAPSARARRQPLSAAPSGPAVALLPAAGGIAAQRLWPCEGEADRAAYHAAQLEALDGRTAALARGEGVTCVNLGGERASDVLVVTVVDGMGAEYKRLLRRHREAYVRRAGYGYCQVDWRDEVREPAWAKLAVLRVLLHRAAWLWWLDSDALVANMDLRAEAFFPRGAAGDERRVFVWTANNNCKTTPPNHRVAGYARFICNEPKTHPALNTGSFMLRSGEYAKRWLERMYLVPYGTPRCRFEHVTFWEQRAISDWIKDEPDEADARSAFWSADAFNTHPTLFTVGDGVLHTPSLGERYHMLEAMLRHDCFEDTAGIISRGGLSSLPANAMPAIAAAASPLADEASETLAVARRVLALAEQQGGVAGGGSAAADGAAAAADAAATAASSDLSDAERQRIRLEQALASPITASSDPTVMRVFEAATGGKGFAVPLRELMPALERELPGRWPAAFCAAVANHAGDKQIGDSFGVGFDFGRPIRVNRCMPDFGFELQVKAGLRDPGDGAPKAQRMEYR